MTKISISGSWRTVNDRIEADVRKSVHDIIRHGNSIVSGGALGVDWIATDEAIKLDPTCRSVRIILPTPLAVYSDHFFSRAAEGLIQYEQAETLISQLKKIHGQSPGSLREMGFDVCTKETYYARNQEVIDEGDELLAFHVNQSEGVQDAIERARLQKKPIQIREYTIPKP